MGIIMNGSRSLPVEVSIVVVFDIVPSTYKQGEYTISTSNQPMYWFVI